MNGDFSIPTTSSAGNSKNPQNSVPEYVENPGEAVYLEENAYYYQDDGNGIIYGQSYEELPQQVLQEEVVEGTYEPPPPIIPHHPTNKSILIKDTYPANSVLLTTQSLSNETASFIPKCGRKPKKEDVPITRKINKNGSSLNKNLPDMSHMFKVLSESAIAKADSFLKNEKKESYEEEVEMEKVGGNEEEEDEDEVEHTPPPMEKIGMDGAEFTNSSFDQWPLYCNQCIDFKDACELLIGIQPIDEEKVCKTLPQQFKHTGTFIADLRTVIDITSDSNGIWDTPSGKTRFYKENADGNLCRADDGKGRLKPWTKDFTYKIQLRKYENRVTKGADEGRGQFQRKIYTGIKSNSRINFAIITYSWSNGRAWNFVPPVSTKIVKNQNWEKKSYEKVDMTTMPQMISAFYEGFNIYSCCVVSFDEACGIMLGATPVDANKICPAVPLGYRQNGTFVIDLKRMGHCLLELRRDDNGIWYKPSGFSRFYKFTDNGDAIRIDKAGKLPAGMEYDVKISSKRYEHTQVDKKFVRKIYTAKGKNSDTFLGSPDFAVIVYYWKGEPIPFEPNFKQNGVRADKLFERYQRMEEVEDQFVETAEPQPGEVVEEMMEGHVQEQIVCEEEGIPQQEDLHRPPPPKRGRFQSEAVLELKMNLIRQEIQNQNRFSAVLDRTETILSQMEQRMGVEMNVYPEEQPVVWNGQEIIEEQVIHDHDNVYQ